MKHSACVLVWVIGVGCGTPAKPCALDRQIDSATCTTLLAMALPSSFAADPTNAYVDNSDAQLLGFKVFFGKDLSAQAPMGCATCHSPEDDFTERTPTAQALGTLTRNAPTAMNAAWTKTVFWDGRVDVLWAQPIISFENPLELNFSRLELAHGIAAGYSTLYENVFGALPPLADSTRFPPAGRPGDPAFSSMSAADQDAVNRIAANVGKALEAYLRKLAAQQSAFDRYLAGSASAITPHQELGMLLFVQDGCAACHNGPQLSDQKFHNAGVSPLPGVAPDRGRADGIAEEAQQLFSAESAYSDQPQPAPTLLPSGADLGAFRTPSLRNVAITQPYMHNGSLANLADAVAFHLSGGGAGYVGTVDPLLAAKVVSSDDQAAIVDFLSTLTGAYPPPPWNFWPNGP